MPAGDQVDSFIILPPSGARSDSALREVEALKGCFPEYEFLANGESMPFDGEYQVLPICGVGGDEPGTLRVLDHPDQLVMMGIAAALKVSGRGRSRR